MDMTVPTFVITMTLQTTFVLVAVEIVGGATARVPVGDTAGAGLAVGPLRDPGARLAARPPLGREETGGGARSSDWRRGRGV